MKPEKDSFFHWNIIGFSFVTLALVYGIWYAYSVFFVALLKEFGWSRSVGAGAFSLFIIVSSSISPFVGNMVYSAGPRKVIIGGAFLLGGGLILCSLTQSWWQLYLFFGVITAMGLGASGWVPNITLIQLWFKEKRGLATGIISSGIGVGILVCVPAVQYLIDRVGWRMAYRIVAIFVPLVVISMAMGFLKRPPKTSLFRSGEEKESGPIRKDRLVVDETWTSRSWTIRQALSTKKFWLLGLSFFLGNSITQSIFTHQVAFFVDRGLEALFASYLVGIVGIVSLGSKILWAALSDRIGREITYTMGITFSILSMVALILFSFFPLSFLPYSYALCFGMGYAVTAALPPLITADLFEGHAYGGIFGSLMIFVGIGGAFGAWFAGFIHDWTGTYIPLFMIMIIFTIVACLNLWWVAPRKIRMVPGRSRKVAASP
ncbi:MAG: MFS transporter [Syntrophaceae bacterium]|nr:MFS transporter [Syntrophaceae bacterium]